MTKAWVTSRPRRSAGAGQPRCGHRDDRLERRRPRQGDISRGRPRAARCGVPQRLAAAACQPHRTGVGVWQPDQARRRGADALEAAPRLHLPRPVRRPLPLRPPRAGSPAPPPDPGVVEGRAGLQGRHQGRPALLAPRPGTRRRGRSCRSSSRPLLTATDPRHHDGIQPD